MCASFLIKCVLLIVGGCSLAACSGGKRYYESVGSIFHTRYSIKYEADEAKDSLILAELERFDRSLNPFNPNSVIAKVNRNEPVEVDPWFREVFLRAMEVSAVSEGAYDITCAPLVNLWGFGFSRMDSVTPAVIDSLRSFVGYQKVRLVGNRVEKEDPRVQLNCSSIAKGYACDVIAQLLEREGVRNYMIEIGGEVTLRGVNPAGQGWRVGINKPNPDTTGIARDNGIEEVVQLNRKGGIATSGDYRNFYIKDGKKYAHTINPLTGYPAGQNILSATIVADDCMTADAYATTFMVVGLDRAREIARQVGTIDYFIIYADSLGRQRVAYSEGMTRYLPNRQALSILENP